MCRPTNENKSTALIWVFSIKWKTKSVYFSPESLDQHQHEFAFCKLQIESPLGSPGNHVEPRRHMEVGGLCLSVKCGEIETVQVELEGVAIWVLTSTETWSNRNHYRPCSLLGFADWRCGKRLVWVAVERRCIKWEQSEKTVLLSAH